MNASRKMIFFVCFLLLILMPLTAAAQEEEFNLPQDRAAITAENAADVTELATLTVEDDLASVALSPSGELAAYGSYGDNHVHLVDLTSGEELAALEGHTAAVTELAFSPDGSVLASSGTVNLSPPDGSVRLWSLDDLEAEPIVIETSGVNQLVFSTDGTLLAGAGGGDPLQVTLWDVETGEEAAVVSDVFSTAAISPDLSLLAAGSRDNLVHLWNLEEDEEHTTLTGHDDWVSATAFSPDGSLLATGSYDFTVRLWDVEEGEELMVFEGHEGGVEGVLFSPDASLLASLGNGVVITVSGSQFSISISAADQVVRLWDVETGDELNLLGETGGQSDMSADGEWTLLATIEGTALHLWGVAGEEAAEADEEETEAASASDSETDAAEILGEFDTDLGRLQVVEAFSPEKWPEGCNVGQPGCFQPTAGNKLVVVLFQLVDENDQALDSMGPAGDGWFTLDYATIYIETSDGDRHTPGYAARPPLNLLFGVAEDASDLMLFWPDNEEGVALGF